LLIIRRTTGIFELFSIEFTVSEDKKSIFKRIGRSSVMRGKKEITLGKASKL